MENNELVGTPLPNNIPDKKGLGEIYFCKMETIKGKINQVDSKSGMTETIASVKNRAIIVAMELQKLKITPTSNAVIISKKHMDYTVAILGCIFAGVVITPIDTDLSYATITRIISMVKPSLIFSDERMLEVIEKYYTDLDIPQCPTYVFGLPNENTKLIFTSLFQQKPSPHFKPVPIKKPKQTAAFLFTSEGTSGLSKLIAISHYAMLIRSIHLQLLLENCKHAISYCTGIANADIVLICTSFALPITRIILHKCNELEMCKIINVMKIDFAILGNVKALNLSKHLRDAKDYDVSCLKQILIGGGPISAKNMGHLVNAFPQTIINAYATMECGFITSSINCDDAIAKPGACGFLNPGVTIKILDVDMGCCVGPDTFGELWCKSEANMSGYYESDTLNCQNKYIKLDDIGKYDINGCIYVLGSTNDVFKSDGQYFSGFDIERVLSKHEGIKDVCVIGDKHAIVACIVKQNQKLRSAELYTYLKRELPSYQIPHRIRFFNELRKTKNGKMKKFGIKYDIKMRPSFENI